MQVLLLGPLDVRHDGRSIPLRRGGSRALLSLLALHAPHVVPSDVLIDRLWGEDLPAHPANALQLQVSYLRRALAPAVGGGELLVTAGAGYRLAIEPDAVDLRRFERLAGRARSFPGPSVDRLALLDEALALWRGDPLEEVASLPSVTGEITRLRELHLALTEWRIDALVELGRSAEAIVELGSLVASFPLHERFHAQLMRCLYRAGRQAEALRVHQALRERLREELGLDVGPEVKALELLILGQDDALAAPAPAPAATAELAPGPRPQSPPRPVTSLIGRDDVIERVGELVRRHRLVTLTGPGGSGKTRVAIEVAGRTARGNPVFFIDLDPVGPDHDVARTIADQLRIANPSDADAVEVVVEALADVAGLLVLDTCEHVAGPVTDLVGRLLVGATGLRILATSRRPLDVAGELAWAVSALSLPPEDCDDAVDAATFAAVELFCERARAVRPGFQLDAGNVGAVVAVCHAVDGLALAIELAAAHVDVLSPAAIRSRLRGRFELLQGHRAAGPERHRALRATIDWSLDLLTAEDRAVLHALVAFAGPFDLEAAAAVAEVDDVLPPLASLVRQSLVAVVADDRYRVLESVRAHVSTTDVGAPALEAAQERHARLYAQRARDADRMVRGGRQLELVRALEDDMANHRVALQRLVGRQDSDAAAGMACALAWVWTVRGNVSEANSWLGAVLERPDLSATMRIRALLAASMVAAPAGQLERADNLAGEAAELARACALPRHRATALLNRGVARWALASLEESDGDLEEALALFHQVGSPRGAALAALNLARNALDRGDVARAQDLLEQASGWYDDDDLHLGSLVVTQQARLALHIGDHRTAAGLAAVALESAERLRHQEVVVSSLHVLGSVHVAEGRSGDAEPLHRRALSVAVATGHLGSMIEAVEGLAVVAAAEGRTARAATLFAAADLERRRGRVPVSATDAARLAPWRAAVTSVAMPVPFRALVEQELSAPG